MPPAAGRAGSPRHSAGARPHRSVVAPGTTRPSADARPPGCRESRIEEERHGPATPPRRTAAKHVGTATVWAGLVALGAVLATLVALILDDGSRERAARDSGRSSTQPRV